MRSLMSLTSADPCRLDHPTWRINLPTLKASFTARDRDQLLNEFLDKFLDELESMLFISRPRLESFSLGDARPQGDDKLAEKEVNSKLRSRRQSSHKNIQPRIVLTSGRGAGKTAVAIELAHRIAVERLEYSIFWVDATSATSIRESYQHIWKSVGEPQGPLNDSTHALVYHLNWEIRGRWLMILDGIHAHTLQHMVLKGWIPSSLWGTLLCTSWGTSRLNILGAAESVEVPPLPPPPPLPSPRPLPSSPRALSLGSRSSL